MEETRAQLTTALQVAGHPVVEQASDRVQHIRVRFVQALAREAGDPDANFLDGIAAGVSADASGPLPRTPAILEQKVK